jgi:hypothetical protein
LAGELPAPCITGEASVSCIGVTETSSSETSVSVASATGTGDVDAEVFSGVESTSSVFIRREDGESGARV